MTNTVVLDLFLGDSGKGKIVDYLAEKANAVIRFNGSNNAGHTLKLNGETYKTHALPSGVLYLHITNYIGHGCAIDPKVLLEEIEQFKNHNNKIFISGNAHVIHQHHIVLDTIRESKNGVGSTKRGVAPAYEAKAGRYGIQYKDFLLSEEDFNKKILSSGIHDRYGDSMVSYMIHCLYKAVAEKLKPYIVENSIEFIHDLAIKGPMVFEGAQGTFLDIDIGEYPFVTSSNCTIGAVLTGTGLNMKQINEVIGVVKAYGSYVGTSINFMDIKDEDLNNKLCELGQEYGSTTGRRRRLCWLDLDRIELAVKINGPTKLAITRMDTLGQLSTIYLKHKNELIPFEPWGDLKGITNIEHLPISAKKYLNYIETALSTPIWAVGIGAERKELLVR